MGRVELQNVYKRYPDGFQAITDLSLSIEDGEFVILVGPSGCGKSTALRMVAGLEDITEGKLMIGDQVVNDLTPKERDIAMVFQSYALYPHMTVAENMGFALKLAKSPQARDREAGQGGGRHPRSVRAAAPQAQGAVRRPAPARGDGASDRPQPQAFLMDEPLSNLDAKLRVADAGRDRRPPGATSGSRPSTSRTTRSRP
jgi:multiple sugar transport system ATP-binding protein